MRKTLALTKLLSKQYFKNFQGTFFAFVFPLLMFIILFFVYVPTDSSAPAGILKQLANNKIFQGIQWGNPASLGIIHQLFGQLNITYPPGADSWDASHWQNYFDDYLKFHRDPNININSGAILYVMWYGSVNNNLLSSNGSLNPELMTLYINISKSNIFISLLPGLVILSCMSLCIISGAQVIAKLKESVILKRIGITPISKKSFVGSILSMFLLIGLASTIWIVLIGYLVAGLGLNTHVGNDVVKIGVMPSGINILIAMAIWVLNISMCMSIGLLIVSRIKTSDTALGISMLIYFVGMFLGNVVFKLPDTGAMSIMSRMIPFSGLNSLFSGAWAGNINDLFTGSDLWKGIIDITYPTVTLVGCTTGTIFLFKWTT